MQKSNSNSIKVHGFALSGAGIFYLYFVYTGAAFALIIFGAPLMNLLPVIEDIELLSVLPALVVLVIFFLHFLCCFYSVTLEPDVVTLKFFGITIRKIPVSKFKTFCAVGNEKEDVLCLSPYSIDEMADMEEKRLLRSFYYKHNVPFRKRKESWKIDFARDFLNRVRRSPFGAFVKKNIVMFRMHSAVQFSVRKMYPQIPYENYTLTVSPFSRTNEDEIISYPMQVGIRKIYMQPDGIHIFNNKKDVAFIPALQIKTAVRVDIFREYDKYFPHHIPLLYISDMSESELAEHRTSRGYSGFKLDKSDNQALLAMTAATYLAGTWRIARKNSCVIHLTKKNLETVQTLYPHVQFNDISSCWLNNSLDTPSR